MFCEKVKFPLVTNPAITLQRYKSFARTVGWRFFRPNFTLFFIRNIFTNNKQRVESFFVRLYSGDIYKKPIFLSLICFVCLVTQRKTFFRESLRVCETLCFFPQSSFPQALVILSLALLSLRGSSGRSSPLEENFPGRLFWLFDSLVHGEYPEVNCTLKASSFTGLLTLPRLIHSREILSEVERDERIFEEPWYTSSRKSVFYTLNFVSKNFLQKRFIHSFTVRFDDSTYISNDKILIIPPITARN